jgi:spore coat protein H
MQFSRPLALAALVLAVGSCRTPFDPAELNPDWSEATHGDAKPDYGVVFPQDSVNRIDIYMGAAGWNGVRKNMIEVWGFDFGALSHPCCGPYPAGEPAYTDVRVEFKGKVWKHVGLRLKGNSTLHWAWNLGVYKLPFRLKFDALDEVYPEAWNQHFYGFKDVSMSANVFDETMVRERMANDLYRAMGVAAARTASYRVYIDIGSGLEYNGMYTMIELPDDTMVQDQFGESSGNLYKPESNLAAFRKEEFARQNNQASTDYSDVEAVIAAINNTALQKSNPAQWRANLEATFNVDGFLKWLAVSNAIASWDAYGYIAHNYFLYNHSVKKITWIPWDQDLSFNLEPGVTEPTPRTGRALSLTMNEVEPYWVLLRYVADDPVYFARYKAEVQSFYDNVFTQKRMDDLLDKYLDMVRPYVIGPDGERPGRTFLDHPGSFSDARPAIKSLVARRRAVIAEFLR